MTPASKILALAIGLAVAGLAIAQTPPTPAQRKELDAARAQLDQAAQRYAELSRKYGDADAPIRIEKRVLRKPVIGVVLAADDRSGVRIAAVTPGSAAADAGLKTGDRITSVDGKRVDAGAGDARVEQARALLAALDAKTPVRLGYEREGKPATLSLTPKVDDRVMVMQGPGGAAFDGDVQVFVGDEGGMRRIDADRIRLEAGAARAHAVEARAHAVEARARAAGERERAEWVMVAPDVRTEVIRLGSDCKGDDCKLPALAEAFRWNGLNLASVDAGLGRYFGASKGVLVLSTGKELDGLQAGDVIRSIGGKDVATPREAMDALRAQPAGGKVAIGYLRDRSPATAQVVIIGNFLNDPALDALQTQLTTNYAMQHAAVAATNAASKAIENTPDPDAWNLSNDDIVLGCTTTDKESAIRACGKMLVDRGCVDEGYVEGW